jgi:hypothetical protein
MYSIFVNAQSLNLNCTDLSYSLTGLPNSWQSQPFFVGLSAGQTYRVRIKDNCTGCVYEKDYTVEAQDLIPRSECPCRPKFSVTVRNYPINFDGDAGSVTLVFKGDECCENPVKILSLPPLPSNVFWQSSTLDSVPITVPLNPPDYQAEVSLFFGVSPPSSPVDPFVAKVVVQGCDCDEIVYVPVFFVRQ